MKESPEAPSFIQFIQLSLKATERGNRLASIAHHSDLSFFEVCPSTNSKIHTIHPVSQSHGREAKVNLAGPKNGLPTIRCAENTESDIGAQLSFEGVRANVSINPEQTGEHPSAFSVVAPVEKKRKFTGTRSGHSRSVSAPRIGEKHYHHFDPQRIVKRIG
ncbi:hypothetical protein BLNAU_16655 [Blattamonas nauphoetae]|uniref:Uncharacterized protein n=1 Tax=Blattamonas nauphoetae TaxID=2049346 RepID=A0ABQ9XDU9_9EUKA|nr:hypothetical protein BLNAU_16655 [Blattamonas nauphoetae]